MTDKQLDDEELVVIPKPAEPAKTGILAAWKRLVLADAEPPPRRWLLRQRNGNGIVPLGKVGLFAAAGGVGKTMASLQLALAVATGKDWLGEFKVPAEGQGRVLLALGEEDEEEVSRRMFYCARAMGLTPEERRLACERIVVLPLAGMHVSLTGALDAEKIETAEAESLLAQLRTEAGEEGWRLVVLDPLARFAGPDAEKDNAAATRFVETVERFCSVPGNPTVLVVHHSAQHARGGDASQADPNADASQMARGATGLTDGARFVLTLQNERTTIGEPELERLAILRAPKTNLSPPLVDEVMLRRHAANMGALIALDEPDRGRVLDDRKKRASKSEQPSSVAKKRASKGGKPASKSEQQSSVANGGSSYG